MREVTIISFFLFFCNLSYSQDFSLSLGRRPQIAYIGLDNPISCTVEGTSCDSIFLSIDNGTIAKSYSCRYTFRPLKLSDSKIIISKKVKNKNVKIGEHFIQVRNIPDPIASIGGLNGGLISKGLLNAQGGISASPPAYLGFELHYQVKNFVITAVRNKELLFFKHVEGPAFSEEVHKLFDMLQRGDIIIFASITVLKADGRDTHANAIEFNVE